MKMLRVQTDAGFHIRLVGDNGEPIVWSEDHPDKRDAANAAELVAEFGAHRALLAAGGESYDAPLFEDVDERE